MHEDAQRYGRKMAQTAAVLAVGWCHSCGTIQLRDEMPREWMPWSEAVESACVTGDGEPWGMGVWDRGEHLTDCPAVAAARARIVDWTPVLDGCGCPGLARQ